MTNTSDKLLREIEVFCKRKKVAISTFGRLSVNDGKLVSRLKSGNDVTLKTRRKIINFIKKGMSDIDPASSINKKSSISASGNKVQQKKETKLSLIHI